VILRRNHKKQNTCKEEVTKTKDDDESLLKWAVEQLTSRITSLNVAAKEQTGCFRLINGILILPV